MFNSLCYFHGRCHNQFVHNKEFSIGFGQRNLADTSFQEHHRNHKQDFGKKCHEESTELLKFIRGLIVLFNEKYRIT